MIHGECEPGPAVAALAALQPRQISSCAHYPGVVVTVENVPARLSRLLLNSLDVALRPAKCVRSASERVPILRQRFGSAFRAGHPFEQRDTLHVTDVREQTFLSRVNCE